MSRIKTRRLLLGMTQEELESRSGVSQAVISQYETGQRSMTAKTLRPLARALDCSMADLIGEREGSNMDLLELAEVLREKAVQSTTDISAIERIERTIDLLMLEIKRIVPAKE